MKLENKVAEITSNASFDETVTMSVDNNSLAHIMQSLTNIYSDGYIAVAREVISNALDASLRSLGLPEDKQIVLPNPIEVTSPNALGGSTFTVKDYGTGMDRDTLVNIYTRYGASTKRENNVEAGGFGLGAKSPLAISDQFVVTSMKDGKKNTVIFQKNEEGVGVANFLEEEDTDAPNGTIVSVTVDSPARMVGVLSDPNLLLGFPANSVLLDGKAVSNTVYNADNYIPLEHGGWVRKELLNPTTNTGVKRSYNPSISIIVGNVTYSVSYRDIQSYIPDGSPLKSYYDSVRLQIDNVILYAPVGRLSLTPSRDSLIMDKRTIKVLVEAFETAFKDLNTMIGSTVFETREKAFTFVNFFRSVTSPNSVLWQTIDSLRFEGEAIPYSSLTADKDANMWAFGQGFMKSRLTQVSNVSCGEKRFLIHSVESAEDARSLLKYRNDTEFHESASFVLTQSSTVTPWDTVKFPAGVYSFEDFLDYIKPIHKAILAERRKAKPGKSDAKTMLNQPMSVLISSNSYSLNVERKSAMQLQGSKILYIPSESSNKLVQALSDFSGKKGVGSTDESYSLVRIFELLVDSYDDGNSPVRVLRLQKNRKDSYVTKIFPEAENIETVVDNFVDSTLSAEDFDNSLKAYAYNMCVSANEDLRWLRTLSNQGLDIKNEDLKSTMAILGGSRSRKRNVLEDFFSLKNYIEDDRLVQANAAIEKYSQHLLDNYVSFMLSVLSPHVFRSKSSKEEVEQYIHSRFGVASH